MDRIDDLSAPGLRPETVAAYLTEYQRLVRTAALILGDVSSAEDVVQEAFLRFDRASPNPVSERAYLYRIVVSLSRSVVRRRLIALHRSPTHDEITPGADAAALAALERQHIVAALAQLSIRQRQALVLRFYGDLSEAEIAEAMHCKVGTVKATLHQAKRQLAKVLSKEAQ
jgi:RNA polymerase sigma factor (sigma-70 family)